MVGTSASAEDDYFEIWKAKRILELVRRLPDRQRDVIVLVSLLRCSSAEAARTLGTGEGAVRQALSMARRKLREWLDQDDDENGEGGNR